MKVNKRSLKKFLVMAVIITAGLFLYSSSQANQASGDLVIEGRAILFNNLHSDNPTYSALLAANDKFEAACDEDPTDPVANLFYAVTRFAAFAIGQGNGSGPETLMDVVELFGLPRSNNDYLLEGPPFEENDLYGHEYFDDSVPSGEAVRAFLAGPFIGTIDGILNNLNVISTGFQVILAPEETGDTAVEVDYGDVLVLKSAFYTLKSILSIMTAYNLDIDVHRMSVLGNGRVLQIQRDLLDEYPELLALRAVDGTQSLSMARQSLINGINAFADAFAFINAEQDFQGDDLLYFESEEDKNEAEDLLSFLVEARDSLNQNRVADLDEDFQADLNRFFGNTNKSPLDIRAILPQLSENDDFIPGTFPGTPVFNGIFPDLSTNRDLTLALELRPSGHFTIPKVANNSIAMNGSAADWPANAVVFTDLDGDMNEDADFPGMDINQFFMAKDDTYLYMALSFYNNGPWAVNTAGYVFQANADSSHHDTAGDRIAGVWYQNGSWIPNVGERSWGGLPPIPINSYPSTYAAAGTGFIEWKVPLSDMGDLSGKYVNVYSHFTEGSPPQHPLSDSNLTGIALDTVSVSGTISCPAYNGTGNIFIYAFDGPDFRTSRLLSCNYIGSPGPYQLSGLRAGMNIFLFARWDKDDNGIRTFGDYGAFGGLHTVPEGGLENINFSVNQEIDDNYIMTKPGLYRVFGSNSYNIPQNYQGPWDPNLINWGDSWTFIGESDKTEIFITDQYYETLLILWHSNSGFNFDAVEDLVAGTAFAEDAGGNPSGYSWVSSGLGNYDTDEWIEPSYFKGHRDRLYASTSGAYGFSLFPMPTDSFDPNSSRQLRITLISDKAGDMNGDDEVDLKDVIMILQSIVGLKPYDLYVNIHSDSQIGLEEAIQSMQIIAGIRGE